MLDGKFQRGFSIERLAASHEPKVRKDDHGYYIMSLSENCKVNFEDYYGFLRQTYDKAKRDRDATRAKLARTSSEHGETIAFYRARLVVIDLLTELPG